MPSSSSKGSAPEAMDTASADALSNQRFGAYRIVRLIGQGGMGQVYLAERDDSYRQQVAIKVLRRGLDSEEMRWRFRRERQILAGLEHPFIARLYDGGGTEDGRPYLVMEKVEGSPIDRHCDDRRLSIEQRLRLFAKVCQAVAFAHRNLLVHRDLKPNNILVRDDGTPKLLDFGIAKPLSPLADSPQTVPHQGPLTPGYASPEQLLGGDITTASDVYSLGILLHCLLLGQAPARRAGDLLAGRPITSPSSFLRTAASEDLAQRAILRRTDGEGLARRLRGDLDRIVLRALDHQPSRRYPSALELARDVERYLAGYPIASRHHKLSDAVAKFFHRHRQISLIAGGILVVLLASLWRVESSRREVDRERQRTQEVRRFLIQIFDTGRDTPSRPAIAPLQLLQLSRQRLEGLEEIDDQVEIALRHDLGQIYHRLSHHDEALQLISQALVAHRQVHGDGSVEAAPLLIDLARVEHRKGQLPAAEMHFLEALDLASDGWRNRHRKRRAAETIADAHYGLSSIRWDQGNLEESEALMRRTLDLRRQLYAAPHRKIIDPTSDLATLLIGAQRFDEGEVLLREAMEMRRQSLGEHHPSMFYSRDSLALLHFKRRQLEQAETVYRGTLELQKAMLPDDHPYVRHTRRHLARTLLMAGRLDEAFELLQGVLDDERQPGKDGRLVETLQLMGRVLSAQGQHAEAIHFLQEIIETADESSSRREIDRGLAFYHLARAESALGREIAGQHFRQALHHLEASPHTDASYTHEVRLALGNHLLELDRPREALAEVDTILAEMDQTPPHQAWHRQLVVAVKAACWLRLGRQGEAESMLRRSLEELTPVLGAEHSTTVEIRRLLDGLAEPSRL